MNAASPPLLQLVNLSAYYRSGFVSAAQPQATRRTKETRTLKPNSPAVGDGIHGVNLQIEPGEFFGLVGESGSGKTTLARVITGQIPCDTGSVFFNGRDITRLHGSKRIRATRCGIQMVFQDPYNSFNPRLPIGFQMAEPLLVAGVKEVDQRRNRVCSMLEKIGLSEEVLDRYPGELSGGQLQRIAIGTALITHPDLLVADEPVSALDVSVQAQILDLFQELRKLLNFTCLFISHDLDVVYYLCDRVAVMDRGELVEQGRVEEIYQNPRHERTKALTRHLDFSDLFDASAE